MESENMQVRVQNEVERSPLEVEMESNHRRSSGAGMKLTAALKSWKEIFVNDYHSPQNFGL